MKKPKLCTIDLKYAIEGLTRGGDVYVTMSKGQKWDGILDGSYKAGCILLELNSNERPIAAYQKAEHQAV